MDIESEGSPCNRGGKARILFFIGNMSHSGGTERVLSVIANGLAERGHSVSVMSLWGNGISPFPLHERIKVYWVGKQRRKKGITGNLIFLTEVLRYEKTEILIDVDIILGCYSFFLKRSLPYLHWISWEHFNFYYHFRKNHLLRKVVRRAVAAYADCLVVLTEEDKGYYQKNMKLRCRLSRIYNPVPYETAVPKREEFPFIFAAGRLTRAKGFDLLVRSWKLLEKKYPQWRVVVAGQGEDERKLKRMVKYAGLKRFCFAGAVTDIEKYYRKAAFFVLPSRDEGFGMVLVEAMSFSLPAVSYACKAGPGEIVRDKETGFLVETGNVTAFAEKMEMLIKDGVLRRKMGAKAMESVKRFEQEGILDEWESLIYERFNFSHCSGL